MESFPKRESRESHYYIKPEHTLHQINQCFTRINESMITPRNKDILRRFLNNCHARGLSPLRTLKILPIAAKLSEWLGKDLDAATYSDIEKVVGIIESSKLMTSTKHSYKVVLKFLYKWLEGEGLEYPKKVRWIKTTIKDNKKLLPDDLLSLEDVKKLIEAASRPFGTRPSSPPSMKAASG